VQYKLGMIDVHMKFRTENLYGRDESEHEIIDVEIILK
jgi:hypothetical protein